MTDYTKHLTDKHYWEERNNPQIIVSNGNKYLHSGSFWSASNGIATVEVLDHGDFCNNGVSFKIVGSNTYTDKDGGRHQIRDGIIQLDYKTAKAFKEILDFYLNEFPPNCFDEESNPDGMECICGD